MTVILPRWGHLLREGARVLREQGVANPSREARLLLGHVLGRDAAELIAIEEDVADNRLVERYTDLLGRRLAGEPMSRIRGWRDFYGRQFKVTPDVLDPRPETEMLVELALEHLAGGAGRVLDLGTGSGCILVSILAEADGATGVGLDRSAAALGVARENAAAHGVDGRAEWIEGGWDAARGVFDVIVSNPPYIPSGDLAGLDREVREHDPAMALDGGDDGLDAYRAIVALSGGLLAPGGLLAFEVGAGQAEMVANLASGAGFEDVSVREDLSGIARVVAGRAVL